MQLALNVNDLDESIAFYTELFGADPAQMQAWLRPSRSPWRR